MMKEKNTETVLREMVREKYASIAVNSESCCGPDGCGTDYSWVGEKYDQLQGYHEDADLGLGCGLPTQFAKIRPGDTVVDLGSGAGNDAFIARAETGEKGRVIGVDFTAEMIAKAKDNLSKMPFDNIEFREGSIEDIPMRNEDADVVVSNCVFNLVPNKNKAFSETYRILKPGGHFSISDIVITGDIPVELKYEAELYAGCVSGAIKKQEYLELIHQQGFEAVQVQKERRIEIPDEILDSILDENQRKLYDESEIGIYSITVFGKKPSVNQKCC